MSPQVRGRVRQMREDASYLRNAERRLAASMDQAERDPSPGGSLEAESSEGGILSQQCVALLHGLVLFAVSLLLHACEVCICAASG